MWVVKSLLTLVLLAAIAAYFTRPDEQKAETTLKNHLLMSLAKEDVGEGRGAKRNLILITCKLKPNDCYRYVRGKIASAFSDHMVYTRFQITGFGKTATCYGAFTQFICPGGLMDI